MKCPILLIGNYAESPSEYGECLEKDCALWVPPLKANCYAGACALFIMAIQLSWGNMDPDIDPLT